MDLEKKLSLDRSYKLKNDVGNKQFSHTFIISVQSAKALEYY